ncbi:synaptonemal complex protein 3-like isoform X2 [Dunckerocampus dactyliophorus]|uniref:synaptonemal complex protein 3-like isoform X2 n=1 Tax=Dunckerocampus dactyliophorus TaxID=161453 RepID=UPI00240684F5|nr:synaptonemal complex protein 3-like isoform X2 [Dunckerocampus dactyliophorus]
MSTGKRMKKRKLSEERMDKVFEFSPNMRKNRSVLEDDLQEGDENESIDISSKKRYYADFNEDNAACALVGKEVHSMLERFGGDISRVMQAKRKCLESLTKTYVNGSQHKLEQLWNTYHRQRQRITQEHSQQVSSVLQQWETEAQRVQEQEEKFNNLLRQQQKVLQQTKVLQNQKLVAVRELYAQFVKNTDEMEKSHKDFLQGAQQELRKEMATLQKKILMDTQQQEMASVRKSLQSLVF